MRASLLHLAPLALLLACSSEPGRKQHKPEPPAVGDPAAPPPVAREFKPLRPIAPAAELVPLAPEDHLARVALVLAGRRPTAAERAAVRRDPAALPAIVDAYLDGPALADVVRDVWHEVLLLRVEGRTILPRLGGLPAFTDAEWIRGVSEEPLRLIEHVVVHDLPFGDIVRADYAIASELALAVWGGHKLDPGPDAPPAGWHKVRWDDGQPMAGILSSAALWLRHPSNGTNNHRGQAEVVSDALLCSSFLARDVPLFNNIDLSDEDAVREALTREPGCVSCHQSLDPLASHFFGFPRVAPNAVRKSYDGDTCVKTDRGACYPIHEYREPLASTWKKKTGRAPGFFGLPSGDLKALGAQIADDPRFSMCVARRFYAYFMQVEVDDIPDATAASLQDSLLAADMRIRPLIKAIVLSDDFKAARARDDGSPAAAFVGRKTTRPEQLARLVADLTGFHWSATPRPKLGEFPLLATDRFGFRAMAGGVEGVQITEPSFAYSPTRTLVLQALAAEAAAHAVDADMAVPKDSRRLLTAIAGDATREPAVREQIVALHERLLGETVDPAGPDVDAGLALFKAGLGPGGQDTARAWTLVLTALLQDPRVAFH